MGALSSAWASAASTRRSSSACHVPVRERGPRTDEAIDLIRRLWTAAEITHDGHFYAMDDVRIHPAPTQVGGPPIVIAGRKEAAMRRAARLGDGWMPYLYSARRYAASVRSIREQAAGRDLTAFEWFAFVFVNIDPDGSRAREETTRFLGGSYRQNFEAMVDSVAVAGTPDEVTAKLNTFVDAGARHFVFTPTTRSSAVRDRMIDHLVDAVIPAVREHAAMHTAPSSFTLGASQ